MMISGSMKNREVQKNSYNIKTTHGISNHETSKIRISTQSITKRSLIIPYDKKWDEK